MYLVRSVAMSLLTAVTFLVWVTAVVQGSPRLVGAEECSWGPSYWCANIPQVETSHNNNKPTHAMHHN